MEFSLSNKPSLSLLLEGTKKKTQEEKQEDESKALQTLDFISFDRSLIRAFDLSFPRWFDQLLEEIASIRLVEFVILRPDGNIANGQAKGVIFQIDHTSGSRVVREVLLRAEQLDVVGIVVGRGEKQFVVILKEGNETRTGTSTFVERESRGLHNAFGQFESAEIRSDGQFVFQSGIGEQRRCLREKARRSIANTQPTRVSDVVHGHHSAVDHRSRGDAQVGVRQQTRVTTIDLRETPIVSHDEEKSYALTEIS